MFWIYILIICSSQPFVKSTSSFSNSVFCFAYNFTSLLIFYFNSLSPSIKWISEWMVRISINISSYSWDFSFIPNFFSIEIIFLNFIFRIFFYRQFSYRHFSSIWIVLYWRQILLFSFIIIWSSSVVCRSSFCTKSTLKFIFIRYIFSAGISELPSFRSINYCFES